MLPIIDYLKVNDTIDPQMARKLTGKSKTTVFRYLQRLMELDIIKSEGRFCVYDLSKKINIFWNAFLERFWNIEDSKAEDILKEYHFLILTFSLRMIF